MKTVFALLCALGLFFAASPAQAQEDYLYGNGLSVPYVPTPQGVVKGMLELAKVTKDDFVIDLGCGDGRIVVMAASAFGARAIGYDLDPQRIEEANANARKANATDKAKFVLKDIFEAEIKDATVVTMYLLPSVNEKLKPRLLGGIEARHANRLPQLPHGRLGAGPDKGSGGPDDLSLDRQGAAIGQVAGYRAVLGWLGCQSVSAAPCLAHAQRLWTKNASLSRFR